MTKVPPPPTCHVSGVMCQVSCVKCHMSSVTCHYLFIYYLFFLEKEVKLVGGGSVINGATPSSLMIYHQISAVPKY